MTFIWLVSGCQCSGWLRHPFGPFVAWLFGGVGQPCWYCIIHDLIRIVFQNLPPDSHMPNGLVSVVEDPHGCIKKLPPWPPWPPWPPGPTPGPTPVPTPLVPIVPIPVKPIIRSNYVLLSTNELLSDIQLFILYYQRVNIDEKLNIEPALLDVGNKLLLEIKSRFWKRICDTKENCVDVGKYLSEEMLAKTKSEEDPGLYSIEFH